MSFKAFCRRNRVRNGAIGDFARDWCDDPTTPRVRGLVDVTWHVSNRGGSLAALQAAIDAWNAYATEERRVLQIRRVES